MELIRSKKVAAYQWLQNQNYINSIDTFDLFDVVGYEKLFDKLSNIDSKMKKLYLANEANKLLLPNGISSGVSVSLGNKEKSEIYSWGEDGGQGAMEKDTIFDLASITKMFVAIVYMKMVENGTVLLNNNVGFYTDAFSKISELKISDILSYNVLLKTQKRVDNLTDYKMALYQIYNISGAYSEKQVYSDMPALVLAKLIEKITKKDFGTWVEELIIKPLELKNTHWNSELLASKKYVDYNNEIWLLDNHVLYKKNMKGIVNDSKARIISDGSRILCGNAGIFSSTEDMTKLAQYLLSGNLIKRSSIENIIKGSGWNKVSYKQTFGYQCYRKYSDSRQTEVPHMMSAYSFAVSGYTGCYFMIDILNNVFIFIGGNRLKNCVSKNLSKYKSEDGFFGVNGKQFRSGLDYVYQRDTLRDALCEMALYYYSEGVSIDTKKCI